MNDSILGSWATHRLRALAVLFGLCFMLAPSEALRAAPNANAPGPVDFPDLSLPQRAHGDSAVRALGNRLASVARFYGTTEAELSARLRRDSSLWVDERGRLFHVCQWPVPEDSGTNSPPLPKAAPFPLDDTFQLHSRAGATKVIYLDFDGHDASGTIWGTDAIARPFDIDGNYSNFSSAERERIQLIWQRVAEDYIQYDVDVTTEDPGVEALRKSGSGDASYGIRVVVGGAGGDWYGSAGGVAYLGSFDWNTDTPCWVFPKSLSDSEKNIAEAASHEAGHTFNLSHDGTTSGTEYYTGQGQWAPIMGVGYSKPIVQWSKGQYNLANNTEDDLAKMLGEGISYRSDDHANTIAGATAMTGDRFFDLRYR